jgi:transposase
MEARAVGTGKKNARRLAAHIVFADESGFLLIPSVRKSWAPRGRTPIVRHRARHDRISVISAISVSPRRRHLGLYYQLHDTNVGHTEVCAFLRHLLRHLRGPVIVIWDLGTIHRGEVIRHFRARHPRLHLEYLPPYAPELNPDEGVWKLAKEYLANGRPDDVPELWRELIRSLERVGRSQQRLRGCVRHSELPLLLA